VEGQKLERTRKELSFFSCIKLHRNHSPYEANLRETKDERGKKKSGKIYYCMQPGSKKADFELWSSMTLRERTGPSRLWQNYSLAVNISPVLQRDILHTGTLAQSLKITIFGSMQTDLKN
jgi:hypothetical protein